MVLVVSPDPQPVELCLRNVDRTRKPMDGGNFENIDHHGLGLENLPRHYIKLHGICHPPRFVGAETEKENKRNAKEAKEQYQLVRLPPYYEVEWNPNRPGGDEKSPKFQQSKYNNRQSCVEMIMDCMKVCFN